MESYFLRMLTLLVFLQISLTAKIYDCFTFFNELELLTVRLEELYENVDYFVLVEAKETFTGLPKPLYFSENTHLFEKYMDKIIHVVIDDFPLPTKDLQQDRWTREEFSRNAILKGLNKCENEDIILISDLDEIPSKNSILEIKQYLDNLNKIKFFQKRKVPYHQFVCSIRMKFFMFQLNFEGKMYWDGGSKAIPYWFLGLYTPWEIKIFHHKYSDIHLIKNTGWHFHSMGQGERILEKLNAIYLYDPIEINSNADSFVNWTKESYEGKTVSIDNTYPTSILDNLDFFKSIGWVLD